MTPTKCSRGRPKSVSTQVGVRVLLERTDLQTAEQLVPEFDKASPLGVRHTRMDVLRAAIARGLRSLRSEIEAATNG